MINLYNSLTQKKELFKPLQDGKVSIYVCGMTVYDYCHIGHARVLVVFDVITRYLQACGMDVNYIRNITDIDDKIIKRAQENDEPFTALTERMISAMHEDVSALGVLPPTQEPRATHHIDHMIALIQTLLSKNYAYISSTGDVYYAVGRFKNYGELAHQHLEELQQGARIAIDASKQDAADFVLWKLAKPNEPAWDSPWGRGRPGWHIECSAMSMHCLGEHFDIHGGGLDLRFPHHQNEIAQSEAASGKTFVNTWIHIGFVQINKEKMSKSLNNFFTLRTVLEKYPAEVVRYFLIASHYRSPVNFSDDNLKSAYAALERFYITLRGLPSSSDLTTDDFTKLTQNYTDRFHAAMDDDFNTPLALAVLFDLAREINSSRDTHLQQAACLASLLRRLASPLGLLQNQPETFLTSGIQEANAKNIENLIALRTAARKSKNWLEADRIREELLTQGIHVEDVADTTIWRRIF